MQIKTVYKGTLNVYKAFIPLKFVSLNVYKAFDKVQRTVVVFQTLMQGMKL